MRFFHFIEVVLSSNLSRLNATCRRQNKVVFVKAMKTSLLKNNVIIFAS
jgi:hypothetical protein